MPHTLQNLRARLPATGPGLLAHYAVQVEITGTRTTEADAFAAWSRWLAEAGGVPERPLTPADWPGGDHAQAAAVIREVARYAPTPAAPAPTAAPRSACGTGPDPTDTTRPD